MFPLIEGRIESVSPAGVVRGWMRDVSAPAPCRVQITLAGQVLAEALADLFRRDLLGNGHGHYGFAARLRRPLPPGPITLSMTAPEQGLSEPVVVLVPALDTPEAVNVEAMLLEAPGWTTDDVLAHPACLELERNHAFLGTQAFIDAAFRFAFTRWPSESEMRMNADDLQTGRITPQGLLLDLLASQERADMDQMLPSPFDPDFPFVLLNAETRVPRR